jgi:glycosyltransferase involved in cell wall biosynthesis
MNKVGIVVQRCHEDIVGGSESLAWQYATLLREAYEVDVLTTTALDISDWANALPAGPEKRDGIKVVRFPVTMGRSPYWSQLHQRLSGAFNPFGPGRRRDPDNPFQLHWSMALQEDFIRHQGPYSHPMMQFLKEQWRDYRSIIFVTYLYPTSYFGLLELPPGFALFVPTLHDELPAYLSAYKHSARRAGGLIWLTAAEQRVGQRLWGDLPGRIVSMEIDTALRDRAWVPAPYLLYCGRVDPNKGCRELFEYFITFKRAHPSKLRLIIAGKDDMAIPAHEDIEFRGFISEEEKFRLMAGATLFVTPSPNESFSIVTLEAMAQRTPVLANGASEVLVDHIRDSGAGRVYVDYPSFGRALSELLFNERTLMEMGTVGREYVLSRYQPEGIRHSLVAAVESCNLPKSAIANMRQ